MTRSKFENFASSKITQHQSSVDTDALWKAVAPAAPKKKRRVVFWYFLTGLLVMGIVSAILWSVTNTQELEGDSHAAVQPEAALQRAEAISKNGTSDNRSTSEDQTALDQKNDKLKDETNRANDKQKNANVKDVKNTVNAQEENTISFELVNSYNTGQKPASKPIFSESSPNETEINHSLNPSVQQENKGTIVRNEIHQLDADVKPSDVHIQRIGLADVSVQEQETDLTSALSILSIDVEPNVPDSNQASPKSDPASKHKIIYSIGAYGGISATSSNLTAKQSGSTEYLNARNQTEKQLETIQFGLEIGAEIFKGLTLKSGVEVSRIARVFTFNEEVIVVDSVYGLKEIYVNNQTQDTINVYGQTPVITSTQYNKRTYNNISQIDIPVKVGYTFQSGKWRLGMDVGAIINLNTSYTGEILAPDGSFYDLKSDPENWFETNAGIAFSAGLSVGKMLGSSFEMYLAPVYRSPSVFSTDANPIEQKHARFGVNLGLRYLMGQ